MRGLKFARLVLRRALFFQSFHGSRDASPETREGAGQPAKLFFNQTGVSKTMSAWKKVIAAYSVISMTILGIPAPALAGMVATDQVGMASQKGTDGRQHLQTLLARQDVQAELVRYGLDPDQAKARVTALTDDEVEALNGQIDQLVAGGDGIVGALVLIFLVLLFTDIMGWTHIFPFTKPINR